MSPKPRGTAPEIPLDDQTFGRCLTVSQRPLKFVASLSLGPPQDLYMEMPFAVMFRYHRLQTDWGQVAKGPIKGIKRAMTKCSVAYGNDAFATSAALESLDSTLDAAAFPSSRVTRAMSEQCSGNNYWAGHGRVK